MQSTLNSRTLTFWSWIRMSFHNSKVIVILIWIVALSLRLMNIDWDQGNHLHPDERFLTMVTSSMLKPSSITDYLNQNTSTFNPANIGYKFFVYGTWPLTITKYVAVQFAMDTYDSVYKVGRVLSALLDSMIIFVLYRISKRVTLTSKNISSIHYFASLIYAVMVLPIQLSHFYTSDIFMHFFAWASILCVFELSEKDHLKGYLLKVFLSGMFIGFAIASKVSALYVVPLLVWGLMIMSFRAKLVIQKKYLNQLVLFLGEIALVGWVSYIALRIASPYYFHSLSFLDFRIDPDFISSIQQLNSFNNPQAWFPPGVQWIHKTKLLFPLLNIVRYGVGYGIFVFVVVGLVDLVQKAIISWRLRRGSQTFFLLIGLVGWAFALFWYQGTQYAFTMRYFILIYPVLALLAATGISLVLRMIWSWAIRPVHKVMCYALCIGLLLGWTLCFMKIYNVPHTRTVASQWIYDNMPNGSPIAWEHWDDPLPLQLPSSHGKTMKGLELPVFGEDTDQKWNEINAKLVEAHYYVLSSNRAWGSIPTVPERFPRQTAFYQKLFAGETRYRLVKTFTSYPGLCVGLGSICIDLPDDGAEEAFTVYDHPKVMIYKNTQYEY